MKNVISRLLLLFAAAAAGRVEAAGPVLLDFYAAGCESCLAMGPTVEALAAAGYRVDRIDVDQNKTLAKAYRVERVPCFVMAAEGQEVDRVVGPVSYDRLEAMFRTTRKRSSASMAAQADRPTPAWRYESATGHRRAVVRVFCEDSGGGRSIGSGVLITWNRRLAVLTARHVIQGAKNVVVWLCTGKTLSARVLSADATWDVAVLELAGTPEGIAPAALEYGGEAMQHDGDRVESCGYGPDARLACNSGLFQGYRRSAATPQGPDDWMVISGHARGGDSGGPVFNERGRVVGVLWGTDGKEVVCVQAGRLHVVLDAALPPQPFHEKSTAVARVPTLPAEPRDAVSLDSLPAAPSDAAETPALGKKAVPSCLPWRAGRTPPPCVIVQSDPEVRRTLGSIDAKVGSLVDRQRANDAVEEAEDAGPSPLVAGLCVLGAVAAGTAIYFGTQKG